MHTCMHTHIILITRAFIWSCKCLVWFYSKLYLCDHKIRFVFQSEKRSVFSQRKFKVYFQFECMNVQGCLTSSVKVHVFYSVTFVYCIGWCTCSSDDWRVMLSAKRSLIAFPNYQGWPITTPDGFNLSPSYYTKSYCYVRSISGQYCRVIPNSQVIIKSSTSNWKGYKTVRRPGHIDEACVHQSDE